MTNSEKNSSFFFNEKLVIPIKLLYYYIKWLFVEKSGDKWLKIVIDKQVE